MTSSVDPLIDDHATLVELIEAVRALPYGRSSDRTVEGMVRDRRGTCSTKHLFLAQRLSRRFPDTDPQIVHRVYTLGHGDALRLFGETVAATVPLGGLTDVHRYLTARIGERRITPDVTFAGAPWDGRSSLHLACGDGRDYLAGADPDADKRALMAEHCDPSIREPFIAALTSLGS